MFESLLIQIQGEFDFLWEAVKYGVLTVPEVVALIAYIIHIRKKKKNLTDKGWSNNKYKNFEGKER
jgi:hypothetical protein